MVAQLPVQNHQVFANAEAEELILGGILFDPRAMGKVADILAPEHFYVKSHSQIYQVAQDLFRQGSPIDLMIVGARLEEKGILEEAGGLSRLATLIERTVSAVNIDRYAAIVIKHYERRRIRDIAWQMLKEVEDRETATEDLQNSLKTKLDALKTVTGSASIVKLTGERIKSLLLREDLTELELNTRLEELRQELNISSYDWKNNYVLPVKKEVDLASEDTSKALESIRTAEETDLDVFKIFPYPLAEPINKLATWLNMKPAVLLTALLVGTSALHSPATELILCNAINFKVKGNLYGAIIAPPSQKKSPVIRAMITNPIRFLQNKYKRKYERELEEYNLILQKYERLKQENSGKLSEEFPDGRPKEPNQKIFFFTNATAEGILNQFNKQPDQSLLYLKDELAGVFKSANQYRGGRGSDQEDLLSQYDGASEVNLRKSGLIDLESVPLSIFGSSQDKVWEKLMGQGDDDNGQWSRFLIARQPLAASSLPEEDDESFDISEILIPLYERISNFPAQTYRLTTEAYKLFKEAYDDYEQKRVSVLTSQPMQHFWGKAEGLVGKLALNLHLIEYAIKGDLEIPPERIGSDTIAKAIKLINFYALQVESLYLGLGDSLPANLAKVLELSERKGGDWLSAREVYFCLSSKLKKSVSAETIRSWFKNLSDLGKGVIDGTGKVLRFKQNTGHNGHNGHNGHSTKELNTGFGALPDLPDVTNVTIVTNVVDFPQKPVEPVNNDPEKPEFQVGERVEVQTSKGWERGEVVGTSDHGTPVIQIRGKNARLHTAFRLEYVRHIDDNRKS
jgi:hypothetical protein